MAWIGVGDAAHTDLRVVTDMNYLVIESQRGDRGECIDDGYCTYLLCCSKLSGILDVVTNDVGITFSQVDEISGDRHVVGQVAIFRVPGSGAGIVVFATPQSFHGQADFA